MPRIEFTPQLAAHIECPAESVDAETLREALETVFERNPRARSYVLNDQGAVRKHVAIFINSQMLQDRENLDVRLMENSEVYVMQALSGG